MGNMFVDILKSERSLKKKKSIFSVELSCNKIVNQHNDILNKNVARRYLTYCMML